ncbi:hypothetical protein KCU91_g16, partial [Aureobasidium melanogenum]
MSRCRSAIQERHKLEPTAHILPSPSTIDSAPVSDADSSSKLDSLDDERESERHLTILYIYLGSREASGSVPKLVRRRQELRGESLAVGGEQIRNGSDTWPLRPAQGHRELQENGHAADVEAALRQYMPALVAVDDFIKLLRSDAISTDGEIENLLPAKSPN